ncbi:Uncharacterized protein SSS_07836 [Sarcoptes scabiei]|nr:Uncharacterized protein SSS_07836 [Sarcoptes scabiei]
MVVMVDIENSTNQMFGKMEALPTFKASASSKPTISSTTTLTTSSNYDRTWPLFITTECSDSGEILKLSIRVRGDYTIGSIMALIGENINTKQDLSDYALWWPAKKRWLKQCRMTLDQVYVCANTELHFTSMNKVLRIQFPDLNIQEWKVDFSVNVLTAIAKLCQVINVSHPEELSFARPLTNNQLKRNNPSTAEASPRQRFGGTAGLYDTLNKSRNNIYDNDTINQSNGSLLSNATYNTISSNGSMNGSNHSLTNNGIGIESAEVLLPHPKSSAQKARLNAAWLNSSISLYEQDVCAYDLLLLKFKFYSFHDLNLNELTRVNYLYEQLKWSILTEEISCNEDEMYTLAGIMLQISLYSGTNGGSGGRINENKTKFYLKSSNGNASNNDRNGFWSNNNNNNNDEYNGKNGHHSVSSRTNGSLSSNDADEVDYALESLEKQLEGTRLETTFNGNKDRYDKANSQTNLMMIPKLSDKLKISCDKLRKSSSTLGRLRLINTERSYFVLFHDTIMQAFKIQDFQYDSLRKNEPVFTLNLTDCEVNPDALASQHKFCFQIIDSSSISKGPIEYMVRCQDEIQYAKWFSACKQASLGRTMAHAAYDEQFTSTLRLLRIQSKLSHQNGHHRNKEQLKNLNIDIHQFIAPRFIKRKSKEQIISKIRTAHETFANETLVEAQMNFIRICQTLRSYGISLFIIKFNKSKKEELLGVMPDKLVLIDINTGAVKKTWRYKTMINWNINWEVKAMSINFNNETIEFECLSADCKVIHEFIGGYIYMSMRSKDNYQFDEEQFFKLTGGWSEDDMDQNDDEHIAMCRREIWANTIKYK